MYTKQHGMLIAASVCFLLGAVVFASNMSSAVPSVSAQQLQQNPQSCDDVRYLMSLNAVPADLFAVTEGGRELAPRVEYYGDLSPVDMGDYWTFSAADEENAEIAVRFREVPLNLPLEFAVFRGMERTAPFQVITANTLYTLPLDDGGIYTIVVKLVHVSDLQRIPETAAGIVRYSIQAEFSPGENLSNLLVSLEDISTSRQYDPQIEDGLQVIAPFPPSNEAGPSVAFHMGSLVNGQNIASGQGVALYFAPTGGVLVGDWAESVSYTGGDFSAKGYGRTYFLEDFGYRERIVTAPALDFITDSNGTQIAIDWSRVTGVWMMQGCAGVTLRQSDEQAIAFVIPLDETNVTRSLSVSSGTTGCPHTDIRVEAPYRTAGQVVDYHFCLPVESFEPYSTIAVEDGTTTIFLDEGRVLQVDYPTIRINGMVDATVGESFPLTADLTSLDSSNVQLRLDWTDINQVSLIDNQLGILFRDPIRAANGVTLRDATGMWLLENKDSVMHMVYTNGHERLILPAAESYLEIVTPPGDPTFEGQPYTPAALPGEPGYQPRALNNLGGNCTPVQNTLSEAGCPANGHINPANGNLWYAVTDHFAHGNLIDLVLTRSFNNGAAGVDGAFGFGWTSPFTIDYDAMFNPMTNSRVVAIEGDPLELVSGGGTAPPSTRYQLSLDLTWAPRGLVTYTDSDGSQHAFMGDIGHDGAAELHAGMMPGWTLTRVNYQSGWVLTKENEYTILFDRAGRVHQMGYLSANRVLTIHYPFDLLNGVVELGTETPVYITDTALLSAATRRLELYFDRNHHIERSILREVEAGDSLNATTSCEIDSGCYEIQYGYVNGRLDHVIYASGQVAEYRYNDIGLMIQHNDPHAPVAPSMDYIYTGRGTGSTIESVIRETGGESTRFELITVVDAGGSQRIVDRTDVMNSSSQYRYNIVNGLWSESNGNFTLDSVTGFTAGQRSYDHQPVHYDWAAIDGQYGGELVQRIVDYTDGVSGRNSTLFGYGPDGQLINVSGSVPAMSTALRPLVDGGRDLFPAAIDFANGETYTYKYDAFGNIETITTNTGELWRYIWGVPPFVSRIEHWASDVLAEYWAYDFYGDTGLLQAITYYNGHPDHTGIVTAYTWDNFGRLIAVDDDLSGHYAINYDPTQLVNGEYYASMITVTGPLGETYTSTFNGLDQLSSYTIKDVSGSVLRQTNYLYDVLGRLQTEEQLLRSRLDDSASILTTTYAYQLVAEHHGTALNGYSVTTTDPMGRQSIVIYDDQDRLRYTKDVLGYSKQFDYYETDLNTLTGVYDNNRNGLHIVQRDLFGEALLAETTYVFDLHWQFRGLSRKVFDGEQVVSHDRWSLALSLDGINERLTSSTAPNRVTLNWDAAGYQADMATQLSVHGPMLAADMRSRVTVDALSRPIQIINHMDDGAVVTQNILYCPQADGTILTVRVQPGAEVGCENYRDAFELAVIQDRDDRLLSVENPQGLISLVTEADPSTGVWRVRATAEDITWISAYNALGELLTWQDSNETQRQYIYNTMGWLQRVTVTHRGVSSPQESYRFEYNEVGYVTTMVDDVGWGVRYAYADNGLLVAKRDILTANTTSYEYDDRNRLQTIISPSGNLTTYTYDNYFPSRLAEVVTANSSHRFSWNTAESQSAYTLTYTDNLGNETTYHFDPVGLLQQIEQELGLQYTLQYDQMGNPISWVMNTGQIQQALDLLYQPQTNEVLVHAAGNPEQPWANRFVFTPDGWLDGVMVGTAGVHFDYTAAGQLSSIIAGEGREWHIGRAADLAEMTLDDPFGNRLRYVFDSLFRVTDIFTNDQQSAAYVYAYDSDKTSILLNVTLGDYTVQYTNMPGDTNDPAFIEVKSPQHTAFYGFDVDGNLTDIRLEEFFGQDGAEIQHTHIEFVLDVNGLPQYIINSAAGIENFEYDSVGNLTGYQNESGQAFTYVYNDLNQLIAVTGPGGWKTLLGYDGPHVVGICLTGEENSDVYEECMAGTGVALESYTYDNLGRLATQSFLNGEGSSTITYVYNASNGGLSSWGASDGTRTELNYETVGTSLVNSVRMGQTSYTVTYQSLNRIRTVSSGSLNVEVAYDDFDRVARITSGNRSISYTYGGNTYTITDDQTGAWITFAYDNQNHLQMIDYSGDGGGVSSGSPLLTITYLNVDNDNNLQLTLDWSSAYSTDLTLNAQGEVMYVNHIPPWDDVTNDVIANPVIDILIQYTLNRAGNPIQQNIDSVVPEHVFGILDLEQNESEYAISVGYDENHQPLTVRVFNTAAVDAADQLFYMQIFTYDRFGHLKSETRQYHDGTQMMIAYETINGVQLAQQDVLVITPEQEEAVVPSAQMFSYRYRYDALGNVERIIEHDVQNGIETTCAQFAYDSANRLSYFIKNATTYRYTYDVQGRLIADDNYVYIYADDNHSPVAAYNRYDPAAELVFFASLTPEYTLLQTRNGQAVQMFSDGQGQVIASQAVNDVESLPSSIWLFDPYGRMLSVDIPSSQQSGRCFLFDSPSVDDETLQMPQVIFDGMFWDQRANLFFDGSRVYVPGAMQYMQRAETGPNIRGSVYQYPDNLADIPVRDRKSPYLDGMALLIESYENIYLSETLTAEQVLAQVVPSISGQAANTADVFMAASTRINNRMMDWLRLPQWLNESYNLPAPSLDLASGELTVMLDTAPGLGGLQNNMPLEIDILDSIDGWMTPAFVPAPDMLRQFNTAMRQATPPDQPISGYNINAWVPSVLSFNAEAEFFPEARTLATPEDVLSYLPVATPDMLLSDNMMDFLMLMESLPTLTTIDWIDNALDDALPVEPDWIPPLLSEYYARWFTYDFLGLNDTFAMRMP